MKRSKTIFALLLALTLLLGLTPVAFAGNVKVSYGGDAKNDSANFYYFGIYCYDTEGKKVEANAVPVGGSVQVQFVAKTGHTSPTEIKYTVGNSDEEQMLALNADGKGTISSIQGNITIKQVTTGDDVKIYAVSHNGKGEGIASYSILSYDTEGRSFNNEDNSKVNEGGKVVVRLELQAGYQYPETISYKTDKTDKTDKTVEGENGVYTLKSVSENITFDPFTATNGDSGEADSFSVKLDAAPVDKNSVVEDSYSVTSYASDGKPASDNANVPKGGKVVVSFTAKEGYVLPDTISYTMGGVEQTANRGSDGKYTIEDVSGDIVLETLKAVPALTIEYKPGTTDSVSGMPDSEKVTVGAGNQFTTAAAPARSGYRFQGWRASWNDELYKANAAVKAPDKGTDLTLTAEWKKMSAIPGNPVGGGSSGGGSSSSQSYYYIYADCSSGGSVSPSGYTRVSADGSLTVSFAPKSGYSILAVYVDGVKTGTVGGQYTFSKVSADHKIYVQFEKTNAGYDDVPKTGDEAPLAAALGLAALSLAGLACLLVSKRRAMQR